MGRGLRLTVKAGEEAGGGGGEAEQANISSARSVLSHLFHKRCCRSVASLSPHKYSSWGGGGWGLPGLLPCHSGRTEPKRWGGGGPELSIDDSFLPCIHLEAYASELLQYRSN